MPRLSLWKDGKHSNDYKFFDRRISEMFTIGGTGILLHKYLGVAPQGTQLSTSVAQSSIGPVLTFADTLAVNIGDVVSGPGIPNTTTVVAKNASTVTLSSSTTTAVGLAVNIGFSGNPSQPSYTNQSEQNIQDLLWVENRDRKYDRDVYKMRGIYQRADQDFDLSQFGLFLQTGTLFMVFHLRDMMDMVGRKLMAGDVLELEHLKDYDALNQDVPAALSRFYVVSDASWPAEGFSPTWWPHLWRVKLNPMVDSQEYKDIINNLTAADGITPIGQILSTLDPLLKINDAVVAEAAQNVPKSGYDTSHIFIGSINAQGGIIDDVNRTADDNVTAGDIINSADQGQFTPTATVTGYLSGDGTAPNGLPLLAGIQYPDQPVIGNYFLRTDYLPNRLFRFDGLRWVMVQDMQRTGITPGLTNQTLLGSFVNDTNTYVDRNGRVRPEKQSLSTALTPKADNQ